MLSLWQNNVTRLRLLLTAMITLVIGGAAVSLTQAQASAVTTSWCTKGALNLSIAPNGAAAGTIYYHLRFTNQSAGSCIVGGYPTVYLTNSSNGIINTAANHNPAFAYSPITLAPGKTANALVGMPDPANYPPGTCHGPSANIEATPFNVTRSLETPFTNQEWCPGFSTARLQPGL